MKSDLGCVRARARARETAAFDNSLTFRSSTSYGCGTLCKIKLNRKKIIEKYHQAISKALADRAWPQLVQTSQAQVSKFKHGLYYQ